MGLGHVCFPLDGRAESRAERLFPLECEREANCYFMMMLKFVAVILALCACGTMAQSLVGQWTDESGYGISTFVCLGAGNSFNAAYSEAGIMQGTMDEDGVVTGNWYEGGGDSLTCTTGTFELSLDGNRMRGSWECADDDDQHDINEERINSAAPTDEQCARLGQGSVGGVWESVETLTNFWICIDDDEYESSYSYPEDSDNTFRIPGYEKGEVYGNGVISSGFYEETKSQGLSLFFILRDGTLGNFYWQAQKGENLNNNDIDDDEHHGYTLYQATGELVSSEDCGRFSYVEDRYLYDDDDESRSSSSDASFLTASVVAVFVSAICLIAM